SFGDQMGAHPAAHLLQRAEHALARGLHPVDRKAATWMVPTRSELDEEYRLEYLDADIPLTPEVSLLEARKEIGRFGRIAHEMLFMVRDLLTMKDTRQRDQLLRRIMKYEQITDRIEVEVSKYLTKTSTEVRSEEVSGQIQGMLRSEEHTSELQSREKLV